MIEILGLIVETLAKVVPGLKNDRSRNKYASVGAELLIFYNEANSMLVVGQSLVTSLRTYVRRMERHLATGEDPYALTAGQWVHEGLQEQSVRLSILSQSFQRLWNELSPLVDTSAFQRLVVLLDSKADAVGALRRFMETGSMPIDLNHELERMIDAGAANKSGLTMNGFLAGHRYQSALQRIPTNVPWEEDVLEIVKRYLEVREPEAQLAEIASHLESIGCGSSGGTTRRVG